MSGAGDARHQTGLGLVELMVAMVLGLLLLAGMLTIFLSNKQTYSVQQGIAHIQESGRLASSRLAHDVRLAGYRGCHSAADRISNQLDDPENFFNDFTGRSRADDQQSTQRFRALRGYYRDSNGQMDLPGALDIRPIDDSDVLVLRIPLGDIHVVARDTERGPGTGASSGTPIVVDQPLRSLSAGDVAIIHSCAADATIFRVADVIDGTTIDTPADTDLPSYGRHRGIVQRLATVTYFVARPDIPDQSPVLYRKIDDERPEALVDGVDGMRILYHVDGAYRTAPEVADGNWDDVDDVLIAFLVNSLQPVAKVVDNPSFDIFQGLTTGKITLSAPGPDRLVRRVFELSAHPRN